MKWRVFQSKTRQPAVIAGLAARRIHPGFTVVEVLISAAILALVAASSIWALARANQTAAISRNQAAALAIVQDRIERILTENFDPSKGIIPAGLQIGTNTETDIEVFLDPISSAPVVTGTLVTVVTDAARVTTSPLRRARVTLTYSYRGKTYSAQMETLRAAD